MVTCLPTKQAVRAGARHNMPRPLQVDFLTFESGVRVPCDVGYLCANLGLSVLDLDDTRTRQTDVRRASSLNAHTLAAGHVHPTCQQGRI